MTDTKMDNDLLNLGNRLGSAILAQKRINDEKFLTPEGSNVLKAMAKMQDRAMLEYQQALTSVLASYGSLLDHQSKRIDILVGNHVEWAKHFIELQRTDFANVFVALHQQQAGLIQTDMLFGDLEKELIEATTNLSLVTAIETVDGINDVRLKQFKTGLVKLLTDKFITLIPGTGFLMSLVRLAESTLLAPDKAASGAQDYTKYLEQSITKLNALRDLLQDAANLLASRVDAIEKFISNKAGTH